MPCSIYGGHPDLILLLCLWLTLRRDGADEPAPQGWLNYISGKDVDLLTVVKGADNTGTYAWKVPGTGAGELPNLKKGDGYYDGYYLVVEVADFPSVYSTSGEFSIQDASITITAPAKNQKVVEGTTMDVTWTNRGLTGAEKVRSYVTPYMLSPSLTFSQKGYLVKCAWQIFHRGVWVPNA